MSTATRQPAILLAFAALTACGTGAVTTATEQAPKVNANGSPGPNQANRPVPPAQPHDPNWAIYPTAVSLADGFVDDTNTLIRPLTGMQFAVIKYSLRINYYPPMPANNGVIIQGAYNPTREGLSLTVGNAAYVGDRAATTAPDKATDGYMPALYDFFEAFTVPMSVTLDDLLTAQANATDTVTTAPKSPKLGAQTTNVDAGETRYTYHTAQITYGG